MVGSFEVAPEYRWRDGGSSVAAMLARVERIVLGAWDDKLGACGSVWDVVRDRRATHRVEVVGGVLESECSAVLREFFAERR